MPRSGRRRRGALPPPLLLASSLLPPRVAAPSRHLLASNPPSTSPSGSPSRAPSSTSPSTSPTHSPICTPYTCTAPPLGPVASVISCDGNKVLVTDGTRPCSCVCKNAWSGTSCDLCPQGYKTAQCDDCIGGYFRPNGVTGVPPSCKQHVHTVQISSTPTSWEYPNMPTPIAAVKLYDVNSAPMAAQITVPDGPGSTLNTNRPVWHCRARLQRCDSAFSECADVRTDASDASAGVPAEWYTEMDGDGVCTWDNAVFIDPVYANENRYRLAIVADGVSQTINLPAQTCAVDAVAARRDGPLAAPE